MKREWREIRKGQYHAFDFHWAIPFFIHAGVRKADSLGVCQKHFQRESGTKVVFLGGQDKFSRGVIPVRACQGKFSRGFIPRKLVS